MTALSCEAFVEALASKAPVPGGGGAAALVGAIGVALGDMVGSLTVGKERYADVQARIMELQTQAAELEERLLGLVSRDAEVFEPLSKAYGLPKETEEQRAYKAEVMEACLRECCDVPLEMMQACCEAIDMHAAFALKGAAIAISDVGCGVVCCKAALQAASLNVFINTKYMADREYAKEAERRARGMLDAYTVKADEVFTEVEGKLL